MLGRKPACAWSHADRCKVTRIEFYFWKEMRLEAERSSLGEVLHLTAVGYSRQALSQANFVDLKFKHTEKKQKL